MDLQPHDHPRQLIEQLASDPRVGRVKIHLRGNTEVSGTIGPMGEHSVIIKALSGREFFDAYVLYDSITCVEVQTRA